MCVLMDGVNLSRSRSMLSAVSSVLYFLFRLTCCYALSYAVYYLLIAMCYVTVFFCFFF